MKKQSHSYLNPAQDKQDEIFRRMSAEKKIEIGSLLWKMARSIVGDKINYAKPRPSSSSRTGRKSS